MATSSAESTYYRAAIYFLRGNAKSRLSLYSEAADDYTNAIDLKPDEPDYHFQLGMARYDMEEFEEAKKSFSNAIDLDSNKADYHEKNGHACYKIEEYDEAIECFGRAVNLQTHDLLSANLYYWRGMAKSENGKFPEAIDDFILAINLSPQDPSFYRARGMVKRRMDNFKEANEDLHTALKLAEEIKDTALTSQISFDLRMMEMTQRRKQPKTSGRK